MVVVLTPLVSLMFDQKEKFSRKTVEFVGKAQDNEQAIFSVFRGNSVSIYHPGESGG